MLFFNLFNNFFMLYLIYLIFVVLIPRTTTYYIINKESLKIVSMSLNSILYFDTLQHIYFQFCLNLYIYILLFHFLHATSVNFIFSTVLELRFYGCCHSCSIRKIIISSLLNECKFYMR